ncbi:hypothetical protein RSAG8_04051, partial [Rhizoctonia solani AG-8 WAC10335]
MYSPALIEAMPGNIGLRLMYEPDTVDWASDRSSVPSPQRDQFPRSYPSPGLYPSTVHGNAFGGFHNPAAFPNLDPLNQANIPSINHQSPDALPLNSDSSTYHPEGYPPAPSMAPIPPTRLHLLPSVQPLGSEPVSPGGTRRARRQNTCDICGKEVRRPGVLVDHMNSHTGERPHQCPHCTRVFTTRSNMQRHIGNFHGSDSGK